MSKITKHFDFTTPIIWGSKNPQRIELRVSGVGYEYTCNEPQDRYDFDIEQVWADGQEFTNIFKLLESDQDSRLETAINEATAAHMPYLFSISTEQYEQAEHHEEAHYEVVAIAGTHSQLTARQKVEAGDFSGNNLFLAIGSICRDYNNKISSSDKKTA